VAKLLDAEHMRQIAQNMGLGLIARPQHGTEILKNQYVQHTFVAESVGLVALIDDDQAPIRHPAYLELASLAKVI
jgi:hypothetical protein